MLAPELPVVVFIHGGGFVAGELLSVQKLVAKSQILLGL